MKLLKYLAIPAIVLLGACGSEKTVYIYSDTLPDAPIETTNAPRRTTTTAYTPDYTPSYSDEQNFLAGIYAETTIPIYLSDVEIIDLGYTICEQFRSGLWLDDIIDMIVGTQGPQNFTMDMSSAVGIAAVWLCPDQGYKFEAL